MHDKRTRDGRYAPILESPMIGTDSHINRFPLVQKPRRAQLHTEPNAMPAVGGEKAAAVFDESAQDITQ
jgi:hypothetical protein